MSGFLKAVGSGRRGRAGLVVAGASVVLIAALLVGLTVAGHDAGAAAPAASTGAGGVRAIVTFDDATFATPAMAQGLRSSQAGVLKLIEGARVAVVTVPSRASLAALAGRPGVLSVEEDTLVRVVAPPPGKGKPTTTTSTTTTSTTSTTTTTGAADDVPWGVGRVGAPAVWQASASLGNVDGDGVNVAVLDTGIDLDHPDLAGNIEGGYMAVAPTGKYARNRSYDDDNGHGTHVAGTIAAMRNGMGVVGVAPGADLWAVKVLDKNGSGWVSDIVDAIYWAIGTLGGDSADDIDIITMSLGSDGSSSAFETAVNAAYAAGILVVAAAGNDGAAVDYPGAYASVMAVAAVDSSNAVPYWSSRGPQVEIAGPGVSVLSTYRGGGYATLSGTSMATPHVTGAAALIWGADPTLTAAQVRTLLDGNAQDLLTGGRDASTGYGLVRADTALGLQ